MNVEKVLATPLALEWIEKLKQMHGALLFHQSGGCCEGSAPMCFSEGDFLIGDQDVFLGEIGGCPFYMSAAQYEYWKHTQLIIDVANGHGGTFSLEDPEGIHFLTRSRLFSEAEQAELNKKD